MEAPEETAAGVEGLTFPCAETTQLHTEATATGVEGPTFPRAETTQLHTEAIAAGVEGPTVVATKNANGSRKYSVRYEGNASKRWDGREILLDADWLETLYQPSQLVEGKVLSLPWRGKGGRIVHWRAILIPSTPSRSAPIPATTSSSKSKTKGAGKK